jgi:hypothetical protein
MSNDFKNSGISLLIETCRIFSDTLVGGQAGPTIDDRDVTEAVDARLLAKQKTSWVSKSFTPSSLPYTCIVKEAFKRIEDTWPSDITDDPKHLKTLRLFEVGSLMHEHVQSHILSHSGQLWGDWKCKACGVIRKNTVMPTTVCAQKLLMVDVVGNHHPITCADRLAREKTPWEYVEQRVRSESEDKRYRISGKVDGFWITDDLWYVLEIKTIDKLRYNGLYQVIGRDAVTNKPNGTFVLKPAQSMLPLEGHVFQGNVYAGLATLLNKCGSFPLPHDKCGGVKILYVNRDSFDMKSFTCPLNNGIIEYCATLIETVRELVDNNTPLYGAKKCRDRNSAAAKKCPWRDNCFPPKAKKRKTIK